MEKNVDFAAYIPNVDNTILFHIKGNVHKTSEVLEEFLGITKRLFDINEDFILPTRIEYSLLTFHEDSSTTSGFKIKPSKIIPRVLKSKDGVSYNNLLEDIQNTDTPEREIRYIRKIEIYEAKTKLILRGRDEYVDKNSTGLYLGWRYEILDRRPISDPLRVEVSHSSLKNKNQHVDDTDPAFYEIVFDIHTDIFFENTEIGFANRNRLRGVLKKVYEGFNVADTFFLSDKYSEDDLADLVFG